MVLSGVDVSDAQVALLLKHNEAAYGKVNSVLGYLWDRRARPGDVPLRPSIIRRKRCVDAVQSGDAAAALWVVEWAVLVVNFPPGDIRRFFPAGRLMKSGRRTKQFMCRELVLFSAHAAAGAFEAGYRRAVRHESKTQRHFRDSFMRWIEVFSGPGERRRIKLDSGAEKR
jgi:hypothetical protein